MGVAACIYLAGFIDVPAERYEAVLAALPKHIALTEAESGCISFSVTPDPNIEGRLLVSEVFVDQAAFDAHQARTQVSDWARITQGIARHYDISVGRCPHS